MAFIRTIMKPRKLLLNFTLLVVAGLAAAATAKADPLVFSNVSALQNSGFVSVNLMSNPNTVLFGPQISFTVDVSGTLPPMGTDTLRITYIEQGSAPIVQSVQIPFFGLNPPFQVLFTINSPGANAFGIPATLTVDLLNSSPDFVIPSGPNAGQAVNSFTYSFVVATNVPEPATMTLAATGIVFGLCTVRRRRS